jgi:hypothetical protein
MASGATSTVTTNGSVALADGPHVITARQFETGKPPSAPSAPVTITVDTVAPAVVSAEHLWPPQIGQAAPHQLAYTFSESVQQSLAAGDLLVQTLYGPSRAVAVSSVNYTSATNRAVFSLGALGGENTYRATLSGSGVTDAAGNGISGTAGGTNHVFYFHVLSGDVNRDGVVNGSDFAILAANFGKSGMSRDQGDLSQNGKVDGTDFALLASNFGKTTQSVATAGIGQATQSVAGASISSEVATPSKPLTSKPARRKPPLRRAKLVTAGYHPAP